MKPILKLQFFLVFLLTSPLIQAQYTFSRLISTPEDERLFDAAEDNNGNYYLVGRKVNYGTSDMYAYLLVLNPMGEIIYENKYTLPDSLSYFGSVHYTNDSLIIFGAKGDAASDFPNKLWVLILNSEFDIIKNVDYDLSGHYLGDLRSIKNSLGNYVLTCVVNYPNEDPDILLFELSPDGDSIRSSLFQQPYLQLAYDLLEESDHGYKIFTAGVFPGAPQSIGFIVYVDSIFNFIKIDSIPYGLFYNNAAKCLSDSVYIVTGYKHLTNPINTDIGIEILNNEDDFIKGNHFGKASDTTDYVGAISNLDFIYGDSIYFGGTSNVHPFEQPFQPEDSWLLLTNLDSNLNLNWEQYYGGDAFYYLWGLKATQDGGCLLLATRYDENTQDYELDTYILKVNSQGILTSVNDPDFPVTRGMLIYPNPATDKIRISSPWLEQAGHKDVLIFNNLGSEVMNMGFSTLQESVEINLSNFPSGLFFISVYKEGKRMATGKVLVNR